MSDTTTPAPGGMSINITTLSAGQNVQIVQGDATMHIHTGGNHEQSNINRITVGGVETTPQARDSMLQQIRAAEQIIQDAPIDPDTREEAQFNLATLETQLTQERKPNANIMVQAAKQLYRFSPAIAGAVISIFSEPLVGQIVMAAGETAMRFYEALMNAKKSKGT
jgi:hypothetical protein